MLAASGQYQSRRTPSSATFSTMSSAQRQSIASSSDLRRSTSSRSGGGQPTSYVALMRKQKATVWCDRAQHEDPRLVAAQRAAKQRAAIEVLGGSKATGNRSGTGGSGSLAGSNRVTAKIRHHGKAGLVGYNPADNFGVGVGGVPMRLSASEVEGGDSDDEDKSSLQHPMNHHRTGSGRSSLGSARRGLTYRQSTGGASGQSGRRSSGNTPPDSLADLHESAETPVPASHPNHSSNNKDYFSTSRSMNNDAGSAGSGSSGERRDELGGLDERESAAARLASRSLMGKETNLVAREKSVRDPEGLRRRGSVDERTATMKLGAGRLFVANPDASDSD